MQGTFAKCQACVNLVVLQMLLVVVLGSPRALGAAPEVSSVISSQRQDASRLVDIYYDLVDADGDACTVTVQASDDGGATWDVPVSSLSGDVGGGVMPGTGRHIVWNPAADIPGASGTAFVVRVCADDGQTPSGMVLIPGGEFEMGRHVGDGNDNELPIHLVYVDSFYLSVYETTNDQYAAALNWAMAQGMIVVSGGIVRDATTNTIYCDTTSSSSNSRIVWDGSSFTVTSGKEDHPMVMVSWYGAVAYANWRSDQEGFQPSYDLETWECDWDANGYRLPTEAEWEYAARGGEHDPYYRYPWGDDIDGSKANYRNSGDPYENGPWPETTPVGYYDGGQTPPGVDMANGYGLYDMSGNAWEWCYDWYDAYYYGSSPYDNPRGPSGPLTNRVLRGGSWISDPTLGLRCAYRGRTYPDSRGYSWGFRLASGAYRGSDCTDSNTFSITVSGPGEVTGTVHDCDTGDPIVGATVSVGGFGPVQTGAGGSFAFSNVPAGVATVSASKAGYFTYTGSVLVQESSGAGISIPLVAEIAGGGGVPIVVDVRGDHFSASKRTLFLDEVSLDEEITATIFWDGLTPESVRFITPGGTFIGSGSGDTWTVTLDMGADFASGGPLTIEAVSTEGPVSDLYMANMLVIQPPFGFPHHLLYAMPAPGSLSYKTTSLSTNEFAFEAGIGAGTISASMPLFGGKALKVAKPFKFEAEFDSGGHGSLTLLNLDVDVEPKVKIAGAEVSASIGGGMAWQYHESAESWNGGGFGSFDIAGSATVPPPPLSQFLIGPVPVYIRGQIEVGLGAQLEILGFDPEGEFEWNGSLMLDPFPYAEVNGGVGVQDLVALELYLGGGARLGLQYPAEPTVFKCQTFLTGGARIVTLIVEYDFPLLEYEWDLFQGRVGHLVGEPVVRLARRDYLYDKQGYALFTANSGRSRLSRSALTVETPIYETVYDQSEPSLTATDDDLISVWLFDDPARTSVNRTKLVANIYDGGTETWSDPPVAVDDDGTADFHPVTATLPSGDVLAAWENISEVLVDPGEPGDPCAAACQGDPDPACEIECKLEELKSKSEIAVSMFDGATWSAQTVLTNNTWLDRSPRLHTASDGTAVLMWVSNAFNDDTGSSAAPNDIHAATFDGAAWSVPTMAATGVPVIVKSAMACSATDIIYIYIDDSDEDLGTTWDRELYVLHHDGMTWGAPVALTTDGVEDANPQIVHDAISDTWLMAWHRDGDIWFTTDPLGLSNAGPVVEFEAPSTTAMDFSIVTGPVGQVALLWQDPSEDAVDFWYAIYDETVGTWSLPQQLTSDIDREYAPSALFDASGDLVAVYNKVETVYETRTVQVGGEDIVVDNVPTPGFNDLYMLRHTVTGSLAIDASSVSATPANPKPGEDVTLAATARNLGDEIATGLVVAFYDGDPGDDGTLIGAATAAGPIAGGQSEAFSVIWTAPESAAPHDLYFVVDPDQVQEDITRTDNTAVIPSVMLPDLTVGFMTGQNLGPNDRMITVRVLNDGGLTVPAGHEMELRRGAVDGELLTTLPIDSELVPAAYRDMTWIWEDAAPFADGEEMVYAVLDSGSAVTEFDEDNNADFVRLFSDLPVTCPWDITGNGTVDVDDLLAVLGAWGPCVDCVEDINGDGVVNVDDLLSVLGSWGSCPSV